MTRLQAGALCLMTTLAISAAVASSASALPEWSGPFPKPFLSKSGPTLLETTGKTQLKCTGDTNKGEITAPNSGVVVISFTGCKIKAFPCNSPGAAAAGEIVTFPLITTLGYITRAPKVVGLDLSTQAGAIVAGFQCANILAKVIGSVIGRIAPVNKIVKPGAHFALKFTQKKGMQNPISFAGSPPDILEPSLKGGPFEPSGLASADALSFGPMAVRIVA